MSSGVSTCALNPEPVVRGRHLLESGLVHVERDLVAAIADRVGGDLEAGFESADGDLAQVGRRSDDQADVARVVCVRLEKGSAAGAEGAVGAVGAAREDFQHRQRQFFERHLGPPTRAARNADTRD